MLLFCETMSLARAVTVDVELRIHWSLEDPALEDNDTPSSRLS